MELRDTSTDHADTPSDAGGIAGGGTATKSYAADPALLAAIPATVDMVPEARPIEWPPYDEGKIFSVPIGKVKFMENGAFQFKGGTDRQGISGHMLNVSVYETAFAKTSMLWYSSKRELYAVEGHQRTKSGQRIKTSRTGTPIMCHHFRLEEAKGWTIKKARLFAAYMNIAEDGPTTTSMDVARLFREQDEPIDLNFLRRYLPARNRCLEQGIWLAKLGDEAFDLMHSPGAQPSWGVFISQRLPADPAVRRALADDDCDAARLQGQREEMQAVLMQTLLEAKPKSDTEMAHIVEMAILAGFTRVEQFTLFGRETVRETLIPQRFKIYREVDGLLQKRLDALKAADDDQQVVMDLKSGASEADIKRATINYEWMRKILRTEANTVGDISTSLSAFARRLKEGDMTTPKAAAGFLVTLQLAVKTRVAAAKRNGIDMALEAGLALPERDLLAGVGAAADTAEAPTFL